MAVAIGVRLARPAHTEADGAYFVGLAHALRVASQTGLQTAPFVALARGTLRVRVAVSAVLKPGKILGSRVCGAVGGGAVRIVAAN